MKIPKEIIIKTIEVLLPNAKIYLFGSWARGDNNLNSDIDIALDAGEPINFTLKGQILSMLDALNIPQKIDLVDFQRAPHPLRQSILNEGVLWKG